MRGLVFRICGVILVVVVGIVIYLYFYGGLRQYVRVLSEVNDLPVVDRVVAWDEFSGDDPKILRRGILAGNWFGRIWIWGIRGLASFATDDRSVYSFFDGCSEEVRVRIKKGEKNAIERLVYVYNDMNSWENRASVGDYVVVYLVREEREGSVGNLREIYAYNFWLFMKQGIDIECAK